MRKGELVGRPCTYGKAIAQLEPGFSQQCVLGGCESKFFIWGKRFIVDVRTTFLCEERRTVEEAAPRNCGLYCTSKTAAQHGHMTISFPMVRQQREWETKQNSCEKKY